MSKQPEYNPNYPPPQMMPPQHGVPGGQMQPPPYGVPQQQGYPMPPPQQGYSMPPPQQGYSMPPPQQGYPMPSQQNITIAQPMAQPGQTTVVVHEDRSDNVILYILLCLICPPIFIIVMLIKSCTD